MMQINKFVLRGRVVIVLVFQHLLFWVVQTQAKIGVYNYYSDDTKFCTKKQIVTKELYYRMTKTNT